ncbi:MAG: hypothetical protein L6R40_008535 [Gallowayella cf. fulva]|nr:MAG: hypothetical protein L6R40_008535 [Xanthomendoza cf. fulva]
MVHLSHDELEVIETYSINDGLHNFRTTFNTTFPDTNAAELKALGSRLLSHDGKIIVLKLIVALQNLTAALFLRSRIGNGPLIGDISSLIVQIISNTLKKMRRYGQLYSTPSRTKPIPQPTTPPQSHPSFTSSFQQTPWSFNTGSFADASEHRKQVDDMLREELLPTLRIDIPDFIPAVFGHIPRLDELVETVFDRCQQEDTRLYTEGSGWTKWPPSAKEDLVVEWLQELMERFTAWVTECGVHPAASRQIYKGPSTYLDGSPINRKMDVGVMARHRQSKTDHGKTHKPKSSWAQMLCDR